MKLNYKEGALNSSFRSSDNAESFYWIKLSVHVAQENCRGLLCLMCNIHTSIMHNFSVKPERVYSTYSAVKDNNRPELTRVFWILCRRQGTLISLTWPCSYAVCNYQREDQPLKLFTFFMLFATVVHRSVAEVTDNMKAKSRFKKS